MEAHRSLLACDATIDDLFDPTYWRRIVPWLSVTSPAEGVPPCVPTALAAAAVAVAVPSALVLGVVVSATVAPIGAAAGTIVALAAAAAAVATAAVAPLATHFAADPPAAPPAATTETPMPPLPPSSYGTQLRERGYFAVPGAVPRAAAHDLERGVHRLRELGHSASAILAYDETWEVAAALAPLLAAATGNAPTSDCFTFVVAAGAPGGFAGPHRDKPAAGPDTFRADGAPQFVTAWVALSDAPPERSCLYVLPRGDDPCYAGPGDHIAAAMPTPASWAAVVAQPLAAGGLLAFSHRILHWGGRATPGHPPRVALSFSYADPAFEPAAVPAALLPLPPLAARVALRAGQALKYAAQTPLGRAQLALDTRVFHAGARLLAPAYAATVADAAQSLKWEAAAVGAAVRRERARATAAVL